MIGAECSTDISNLFLWCSHRYTVQNLYFSKASKYSYWPYWHHSSLVFILVYMGFKQKFKWDSGWGSVWKAIPAIHIECPFLLRALWVENASSIDHKVMVIRAWIWQGCIQRDDRKMGKILTFKFPGIMNECKSMLPIVIKSCDSKLPNQYRCLNSFIRNQNLKIILWLVLTF